MTRDIAGRILKACGGCSLAALMLLPVFLTQSAVAKEVTITRERLACLVSNYSGYLALGKDPLIIFLALCPKAEPSIEELLDNAENSLPNISVVEESGLEEEVIILRPHQLRCLVERDRRGEFAAEADPIKINVGSCDSRQ